MPSNEANQLLMPNAVPHLRQGERAKGRQGAVLRGRKGETAMAVRHRASPPHPLKTATPRPAKGYESLKQISETVANALQDISVLIGQPQQRPVTLLTGGQIVPGLGLVNEAANVATRAKDMRQGVFKVMVLGEFKRGKSTLLNAILGQKILPAKATPATAIITVLVYGGGEEILVYETGVEAARHLSWQAFKSEFQLTKEDQETLDKQKYIDRFLSIEYAQIERPHRFLANGVKLIDSPGLGEQSSRTKVSTNFLKQTQSVIFVLDATQILSNDEKKFIENVLGSGRLNHVFFVVNKINLVDEEQVDEVKEWVQVALKHHFLDESGQFDQDFYNRRVFYVNARGALEARNRKPVNQAELAASGILPLERELEAFLTNEERIQAALQATVESLIVVIAEARRRIANEKQSLDSPLATLEKRRLVTEGKLKELERNKQQLEQTIRRWGAMISQKVYADLLRYVNEMTREETWKAEAQQQMNLEEITLGTILKASFSQEAKEQIQQIIQREVESYFKLKFQEWAQEVPGLVQPDLEKIQAEMQTQLEGFQLKLSRIESLFAGGDVMGSVQLDTEKGRVSKMVQTTIGVLMLDPSQVTGAMVGEGDWGHFIGRLVFDIVLFAVIGALLGPAGWAAWGVYLVAELFHMNMQTEGFRERLIAGLGKKLHETLPHQINKKQSEICGKIQQQFNDLAQRVTGILQKQINEARANQQRIIREKKEATFSAKQKKARLDTIGHKLLELLNTINTIAKGKQLPPAEIDRLAEGKRALMGG